MPINIPENFTVSNRQFVHHLIFESKPIKNNLLEKIVVILRECFNLYTWKTPEQIRSDVQQLDFTQKKMLIKFLKANPNWSKRNFLVALVIFKEYSPLKYNSWLEKAEHYFSSDYQRELQELTNAKYKEQEKQPVKFIDVEIWREERRGGVMIRVPEKRRVPVPRKSLDEIKSEIVKGIRSRFLIGMFHFIAEKKLLSFEQLRSIK